MTTHDNCVFLQHNEIYKHSAGIAKAGEVQKNNIKTTF